MITNLPVNTGWATVVRVIFFALLVAFTGIASAQTAPGILPIHAQAERYYLGRSGDDWQCERGFTKHSGSCVAVVVPKNAYLDASGTDWQCERGFSRKQATCNAIAVPANAYIASLQDRSR